MRFCREYAHFVPFITQILLRQMLFDSDFTQIYVQKNGEWSLCLAAAPRLRRRRPAAWLPGAGGEAAEVEAGVGVEASASSSIANLMLDLPPLVEMVRLAVPPASLT